MASCFIPHRKHVTKMITPLPSFVKVLDLLSDPVCVADLECRFLFVNASFERIFGYTREEVAGRHIFDFVFAEDRKAMVRQAEQVMTGMPQHHFRNRYRHKQGHFLNIHWSAHWLPEHGVRVGVGREVTDIPRAERENEGHTIYDLLARIADRRDADDEL